MSEDDDVSEVEVGEVDALEIGEVEPAAAALTIDFDHDGQRLDAFLVQHFGQFSRTQIRKAIDGGRAFVDGERAKVAYKLREGQRVEFAPPLAAPAGSLPEAIPLNVLYEDDDLAVIDKPAGMVVHPGRGHWSGTLTAALVHRYQDLSQAGGVTRPGIVHRLDRDTSGLMLVARNDASHLALAKQFENRTVQKRYWALVHPSPDRDRDIVDEPVGPHPYQREKMAIRRSHPQSRDAVTFYETIERFGGVSVVHAHPKTGRTHQIRLHMTHVGSPILCDKLYGGRARVTPREALGLVGRQADTKPADGDPPLDEPLLSRQALHAHAITFRHPTRETELSFEAPLAADLAGLLQFLRRKTIR